MSKLFVFSDVHGFYDEFIEALNKAGYDEKNPEHQLISLGDNFDRGPGCAQMLAFLNKHKEAILVEGNHEMMMRAIFKDNWLSDVDYYTGMDKTITQISGLELLSDEEEAIKLTKKRLTPLFKRLVNYVETDHYIMTHGFLPLSKKFREVPPKFWQKARWTNGIEECYYYPDSIKDIIGDKTIVFGHYCCSQAWMYDAVDKCKTDEEQWAILNRSDTWQFGDKANHDIYYGNQFIAIDATTALTKQVNILVLDNENIIFPKGEHNE